MFLFACIGGNYLVAKLIVLGCLPFRWLLFYSNSIWLGTYDRFHSSANKFIFFFIFNLDRRGSQVNIRKLYLDGTINAQNQLMLCVRSVYITFFHSMTISSYRKVLLRKRIGNGQRMFHQIDYWNRQNCNLSLSELKRLTVSILGTLT